MTRSGYSSLDGSKLRIMELESKCHSNKILFKTETFNITPNNLCMYKKYKEKMAMSSKEKMISLDEATREVEITSRRIALLHLRVINYDTLRFGV
jgi:hypothetical protein